MLLGLPPAWPNYGAGDFTNSTGGFDPSLWLFNRFGAYQPHPYGLPAVPPPPARTVPPFPPSRSPRSHGTQPPIAGRLGGGIGNAMDRQAPSVPDRPFDIRDIVSTALGAPISPFGLMDFMAGMPFHKDFRQPTFPSFMGWLRDLLDGDEAIDRAGMRRRHDAAITAARPRYGHADIFGGSRGGAGRASGGRSSSPPGGIGGGASGGQHGGGGWKAY